MVVAAPIMVAATIVGDCMAVIVVAPVIVVVLITTACIRTNHWLLSLYEFDSPHEQPLPLLAEGLFGCVLNGLLDGFHDQLRAHLVLAQDLE